MVMNHNMNYQQMSGLLREMELMMFNRQKLKYLQNQHIMKQYKRRITALNHMVPGTVLGATGAVTSLSTVSLQQSTMNNIPIRLPQTGRREPGQPIRCNMKRVHISDQTGHQVPAHAVPGQSSLKVQNSENGQNSESQKEIFRLKVLNAALQRENEEVKANRLTYNKAQIMASKVQRVCNEWTWKDVFRYLTSLDDHRCLKYAQVLCRRLKRTDVNGQRLKDLDDKKLVELGISSLDDREVILHHIKVLVADGSDQVEIEGDHTFADGGEVGQMTC